MAGPFERSPDIEALRRRLDELRAFGYEGSRPDLIPEGLKRAIPDTIMGFLPGSGDVMAAQQSVESGGQMAQALRDRRFADALGYGIQSLGDAAGVLPMLPALGGIIRSFHGGPAKGIKKFDWSKIGSGQGAQSFGYGHYSAEEQKVAKAYRKELARNKYILRDREISYDELQKLVADAVTGGEPLRVTAPGGEDDDLSVVWDTIDMLNSGITSEDMARLVNSPQYSYLTDKQRNKYHAAAYAVWDVKVKPNSGALYTLDLDVEPEDLLDWETPLVEQSDKVKKALGRLGIGPEAPLPNDKFEAMQQIANEDRQRTISGQKIYYRLVEKFGSAEKASIALREVGIPGIKYFDQMSRGKEAGTRNFVIFDDELIKVLSEE